MSPTLGIGESYCCDDRYLLFDDYSSHLWLTSDLRLVCPLYRYFKVLHALLAFLLAFSVILLAAEL